MAGGGTASLPADHRLLYVLMIRMATIGVERAVILSDFGRNNQPRTSSRSDCR